MTENTYEEEKPTLLPVTKHDLEGTLAARYPKTSTEMGFGCYHSKKRAWVSMDIGLVVFQSTSFGYLNDSEYL